MSFAAVFHNASFAQMPTTTLRVTNLTQINLSTITFDLWLKNTSNIGLHYYIGQYFLGFNKQILRGEAVIEIIESGLPEKFRPRNPKIDSASTDWRIMYAVNRPPGIGREYIINGGDSVLVMKSSISSYQGFNAEQLNLKLQTVMVSSPATVIYAYIGDREKSIAANCRTIHDYTNIVLTGIQDDNKKLIPKTFALLQNYPNPFNPTTVINYELPVNSHIILKIYDILGREVFTLVNEEKTAGYYEASFNGANLTSGVYIYRLIAQGNGTKFSSIKKMMLVK